MNRAQRSDQSQAGPSNSVGLIGSIGWTEATGGMLSRREQVALVRPLLAGLGSMAVGRVAMTLGVHSGRRNVLDPASLVPPDSALARDAETAAHDLLSPALVNHSRRAYAWGAALAGLDGVAFDAELLFVAAMFHDTGLPSPTPDVDFTVRSAALLRDFVGRRLPVREREVVTNAIAMHHTPGVTLEAGPEAFLLSAGAAVDVYGLRSNEVPDAVRNQVVENYPRAGFKAEFADRFGAEAKRVPHGRAWFLRRYALSPVAIRLAPFRG